MIDPDIDPDMLCGLIGSIGGGLCFVVAVLASLTCWSDQ